jgi:outer membrane protein assembly factor BamB
VRLGLAVLALIAAPSAAAAAPVRGSVFADGDGDGVRDAGEPGVATIVAWEDEVLVRTDADGAFALDVPADGDGLVWARVPAGFRPGPAWAAVPADGAPVDLPLVRLAPGADAAPLAFVVAADTHLQADQHLYGPAELAAAIGQATALVPAPRFFTILGDVTQSNQPEELDQIARAVDGLAVPWVPVAGNHDWYDGGVAWRARFGPEAYSFDVGDVHVVVIDTNDDDAAIAGFLERELGFVAPAATIVVLGHAPLRAEVIDTMERLGVDLYLAGHWHANRVVDHGALIELDTQPFLMGGMDALPAGYRVVTVDASGIHAEHHTMVRAPWLRLSSPAGTRCAFPGQPLVVAAAIDAAEVTVSAWVGEHWLPLAPAGGWAHATALPPLRAARYPVQIEARTVAGRTVTATGTVTICDPPRPPAPEVGAWPQPGGDASHRGAQERAIAPPLAELWATPVGGPVTASPVVGDGRVVVAVGDLGRGDSGGVVALDAATGEELWRVRTELPVRAAPVLAGGLAIAVRSDGTVLALDAATGAERWRHALGDGIDPLIGTVMASPAVDGDTVWVGSQRRFAALDVATGAVRWSLDPVPDAKWHTTLAAPAISGDRVVALFERNRGGLRAWTRDGALAWTVPAAAVYSTNATPVIDGDAVYVATGVGDVAAFDLDDGTVRWARVLTEDRHTWAYAIQATPAVAGGLVVVATEHDLLWALDAATGDARWTWRAGASPLHAGHYRGAGAGFAAAPVITGGIVWAAPTDGTIVALDLETGAELGRLDAGAPVLAGLAAAGDLLIAAGWDGTVHAFGKAPPFRPAPRRSLLGVVVLAITGAIAALGVVVRLRAGR